MKRIKNLKSLILLGLIVAAIVLVGTFAQRHPTPEGVGEIWALDEIGDPAFKEYMLTVLWPRCPFYKPDGASYRECLRKVVEESAEVYKKESPTPEEIDNKCQLIGSNFEGLLAGEIVLSCRAHKLSSE